MTNNQTPTTKAAHPISLVEKIYKVAGAVVAYKVKDILSRPIEFKSFELIPTPTHIREGMEASDQECPDKVGVIGAEVDGQIAAVVSLSQALNDQLESVKGYMPFVSTIELKSSKSGRTYPQVQIG